jgi:hypothetical protein
MYTLRDLTYYFLFILNHIKLMHWMTPSYAAHQALDSLYKNFNASMDKFIEVYQGKLNSRIRLNQTNQSNGSMGDENYIRLNEEEPKEFLRKIIKFLMELDFEDLDDRSATDLFNIRDEMVADINQTLYLLSFK